MALCMIIIDHSLDSLVVGRGIPEEGAEVDTAEDIAAADLVAAGMEGLLALGFENSHRHSHKDCTPLVQV